jgi:hypothetical protein
MQANTATFTNSDKHLIRQAFSAKNAWKSPSIGEFYFYDKFCHPPCQRLIYRLLRLWAAPIRYNFGLIFGVLAQALIRAQIVLSHLSFCFPYAYSESST